MLAVVREPSAADPAARFELLRQARRQYDEGALTDAWQTVSAVADLSRRAEDPATLADAATLIRHSHNLAMTARVHELCAEALARLGDADPVRSARLRAQLVATSNPFGPDRVELSGDPDVEDPDASFLRLRARHAERLNPIHVGERLVLADAAIDLGRRTGMDEYVCWGRRWRMDAYAELDNRLDLTAELGALTPIGALVLGELMDHDDLDKNLAENAIPHFLREVTAGSYREFLDERRRLMAKTISDYYQNL
jgi:hypothetical protein